MNETERLCALDDLGILDTPEEPEFDTLVTVARALCDAPVALISLVHRDRQWFKARLGFAPHETPIEQSVCVHALAEDDMLVIPDLTLDPRTAANTLVTHDPHIRFYAGVPLIASGGAAIGSLCVIDTVPRPGGLTDTQATGLRALAQQVIIQIEARKRNQTMVDESTARGVMADFAARRAEALVELGDRLRDAGDVPQMVAIGSEIMAKVLRPSRAGFGIVSPEDETVMMQPEWRQPGIATLAGRHRFRDYGSFIDDLSQGRTVIVENVATDPRTRANADALLSIGIRVLINVPIFQQGRFSLVSFAHYDTVQALGAEDIRFIRSMGDRMQAAIAQIQASEERHLMNLELSHRMKNTFAMVLAIARQTFSRNDGQFSDFSQRIGAMSAAYAALAEQRWTETDLHALLRAGVVADERIRVQGPPLPISAAAAPSVSMLLHEMATNALKYGALSVPQGRVHLSWQIDDGELILDWLESGGPVVMQPERRGFGSRLIRAGLDGAGRTEIAFDESGLRGRFRADLSALSPH